MESYFRSHRSDFAALLLLAAALTAVYAPSFGFGFLGWDDTNFIENNPYIGATWENFIFHLRHPFQNLYTPLAMHSLMFDHALFGLDALPFRLHNLLLHFAAAAFLYGICRRLGSGVLIALAAAFAWGVHPQKVESVVWITERKDVLCGAFAFASVYFFLRAFASRRTSYAAGVLGVLAIFAKPAAIALPGVFVVGAICLAGKSLARKEYMRILAFPVLAACVAALWSMIATASDNPGVLESNGLVPLHNMFWYPVTALLPFELSPCYSYVAAYRVLPLAAAAVALLVCLALLVRKLRAPVRKMSGIILIVGGLTVPVLGLLHYTEFHYCDRYNYLISGAVWAALAAVSAAVFRKRRVWVAALFACAAAYYIVRTETYIPFWRDAEKLFDVPYTRDPEPNLKVFEIKIGYILNRHDVRELGEFARRFDALRPELRDAGAALNMRLFLQGHQAFLTGDYALARQRFQALLRRFRAGEKGLFFAEVGPEVSHDLALLALAEGRKKEAVRFLDLELAERPSDDLRHTFAAALRAELAGDREKLFAAWRKILAECPGDARYRAKYEALQKKFKAGN